MLADSSQTGRPRPFKLVQAALVCLLGVAGVASATQSATAVDGETAAQVSLIVPLVAPATTTGYLTLEEIIRYTLPVGALTRQLDAVADRPVTIAVDPMIIASIRLLGTSAPASATRWLGRLASVTNEIIALPYADSDLTLATQAGSTQFLVPQSFDFAIKPELFDSPPLETATPTPITAPTAIPAPDALPVLPTSENLLDGNYTLEGIAWPRANSVISSDLDKVQSSGFTTTILASGNLRRDDPGAAVATIGTASVLVTDDDKSELLGEAINALGEGAWQIAATRATTSLAAGRGTTVIATLPRAVPAIGSFVEETIAAVQSTRGITLIPLSLAAASLSTGATLVDRPQDAKRVSTMARLLQDTTAEELFSSILENPQILTADRRLDLLGLASIEWIDRPDQWEVKTSEFNAESLAIRSSVQVVGGSSLNFLADNAPIPISVTNNLAYPVTVFVTVRPETALVSVPNASMKLVIEPASQGKAEVPIEAISNGIVTIEVSLTSVSGVPIGSPRLTEINVQAGWETPIVLALGAIVILVFGAGIVRTIRRRRRAPDDDPVQSALKDAEIPYG
jgi:hypothetical protein